MNRNAINYFIFQMDFSQPMPAIGRIANFSSLRKNRPQEHQIYDSYFGKKNFNNQCIQILVQFYMFYVFMF